MAQLVLIAGPNGAGKTTLYRSAYPTYDRIDADEIARSLSPQGERTDAIAAGRMVAKLLADGISDRRNMVFETTFAGRQPLDLVRRAKDAGYSCVLHFVLLESADLHVARVADRVRAGGHEVDETTIRRRYERSVENLVENATMFDELTLIENSSQPNLLMTVENGKVASFVETDLTRRLRERLSRAD